MPSPVSQEPSEQRTPRAQGGCARTLRANPCLTAPTSRCPGAGREPQVNGEATGGSFQGSETEGFHSVSALKPESAPASGPRCGSRRRSVGSGRRVTTSNIQPRRNRTGHMAWASQQIDGEELSGMGGRVYRLKEI